MKHLVIAALVILALAGCGQSAPAGEDTAAASAASSAPDTATSTPDAAPTAAAAGCTAGGLDAMTALSDFQLEMDDAQKAGKISQDQLLTARDTLYNQTQAAYEKSDWAGYCKAIDDMRTELGL